jgi:hypothetical protein
MKQRIVITDISKKDAYYPWKDAIIGQTATVESISDWKNGWFYGQVVFGKLAVGNSGYPIKRIRFHEFKYKLADSVKKLQKTTKSCKKRQE